ncbi:unnamed protein product [Candida parapsilosis]
MVLKRLKIWKLTQPSGLGPSELSGLKHLTKLTDFWCSYNQVSSFENVGKELGKLPDLECVYFEGNPIQTENPTAYRRKLKLYLGPSLNKIDANIYMDEGFAYCLPFFATLHMGTNI